MPLEIKELHIKATVNGSGSGGGGGCGGTGSSDGKAGMSVKEKSMFLKECVDQVLEILKEKEGR